MYAKTMVTGCSSLLLWLCSFAAPEAPKPTATMDPMAKMVAYSQSASTGQWRWPDTMDATIADPRNHKMLLENDRVRVLQVTVHAHEKEDVHTHRWPSVFVSPLQCKSDGRVWDGAGNVLFDSRAANKAWRYQMAVWRAGPEPPHATENLSDEDCTFYRVEIKRLTSAGTMGKWPVELDGPIAASKNHRVILENEFVRVLELSGDGHEKEQVHTHPWPSLYMQFSQWTDFLVHDADGTITFDSRSLKQACPCMHWDDSLGPHWIENLSDQPWHGFRLELKQ
jgi:hypothetical protein